MEKKEGNIFFFFVKKDIDLALSNFGHKGLINSQCFALSSNVFEELVKLGIEPLQFESYFPGKSQERINNFCRNWAKSWYRGKNEIFTNLSLSLHNYFAKKLFQLAAINNLLKIEKPEKVYLGNELLGFKKLFVFNFDNISPVVRLVCKKYQIMLFDQSPTELQLIKFATAFLKFPKIKRFTFDKFKKRPIIFASHHYHVINCFDLLKYIKEVSRYEPLVIGRVGAAQKYLVDEGIRFVNYNGEIEIQNLLPFLLWKFKFLVKILLSLPIKKIFRYDNYDLDELFKPKLISLFLADAPNLIAYNLFFEKLIKKINPAALISVTNDSTIQTFIGVAKRAQMPTLEIQHGITFGADASYFCANKLAVWGQIPKNIYENNGIAAARLTVGGWPAFEIYKSRKVNIRKTLQERVITFLAQDPEGLSFPFETRPWQENLEIFFKVISGMGKNLRIVVRLHPRADKKWPIAIAKKYNIKFELSDKETLIELLKRSSIVIGQTTSATLDAIIMRKPVIYLPSMRWPAKFVEKTGAVIEVNDAGSLSRAIKRILDYGISNQMVEAQKKFVEDYCTFSKDSRKLISQTIMEMTDGKK